METILAWLVVVVGWPLGIGLTFLLVNRRAGYAAGRDIARWVSGEPWHAPMLCIVLAFVALAVAVWSVRLNAPVFFVFFMVLIRKFVIGISGFTYSEVAGSEPGAREREWWRRSRV